MEATVLVGKIHMECPLCDKVHEIEERTRTTTTIIKDVEVKSSDLFEGHSIDYDLPEKKYIINNEAFENVESYLKISVTLQ